MGRIYTLNPVSMETDAGWIVFGAATKIQAISDDVDPSRISAEPVGAFQREYWHMEDLPVSGIVEIIRVMLHARWHVDNTSFCKLSFKLNGGTWDGLNDYFSPGPASVHHYVGLSEDITAKRIGGGVWTIADINAIVCGHNGGNWGSGPVLLTKYWMTVEVTEPAVQLEDSREVASRMLRGRRKPRSTVSVSVPPAVLDADLMTDFGLIHRDAPAADGLGMRTPPWTRGLFRVAQWEFNPNTLRGNVIGKDLRSYLIDFWDTARAISTSSLEDGVARLDNGQVRDFARASKCWPKSPGDGRVTVLLEGQEAVGHQGRLAENLAENKMLRSSFADGPVGYVDSGTSQNSSAILTVQYNDWNALTLFDKKVTSFYARFVAWTSGSPVASSMLRAWPNSASVLANTPFVVSIDYLTDGANAVYRLRRNQDNQWFTEAGATWGGSAVNNPMAASASPARHEARVPGHTSASTYTLFVGIANNSPNGSEARVFHVQLETGTWASSRVVTSTAAVTRSACTLSVENFVANRVVSPERGTAFCRVAANWNTADLPTNAEKVVWQIFHDADNWMRLFYDEATESWIFEVRAEGVTVSTSVEASVTKYEEVALVCRWTAADGDELDLAARTITLFVDGVRSLDQQSADYVLEDDDSLIHFGHEAGTNFLDGAIADVEFVPFSLRDEEVKRY